MNVNVGLKIKQLRSEYFLKTGRKMYQKDLAEKLGISRSYLGDIESGRTIPNEIILGKIADVFDIDLYDIIGDKEDIPIDNSNIVVLNQSKKVTDAIKKIDDNSAIKKYIKNTDFNELIMRILNDNSTPTLKLLKDNIEELSKIEEGEFKEINNINKNDYSIEARAIKSRFVLNSNKSIINKINSILNLEIAKTSAILDSKNNCAEPIAAHAKEGATLEDIKHDDDIMNDDEFWNE